jgi:hypothetical protein
VISLSFEPKDIYIPNNLYFHCEEDTDHENHEQLFERYVQVLGYFLIGYAYLPHPSVSAVALGTQLPNLQLPHTQR